MTGYVTVRQLDVWLCQLCTVRDWLTAAAVQVGDLVTAASAQFMT
jgi:hypothetical protein